MLKLLTIPAVALTLSACTTTTTTMQTPSDLCAALGASGVALVEARDAGLPYSRAVAAIPTNLGSALYSLAIVQTDIVYSDWSLSAPEARTAFTAACMSAGV